MLRRNGPVIRRNGPVINGINIITQTAQIYARNAATQEDDIDLQMLLKVKTSGSYSLLKVTVHKMQGCSMQFNTLQQAQKEFCYAKKQMIVFNRK